MERFQDIYSKHLANLKAIETFIMDSIVSSIKAISDEPIEIGNILYYYVEHNGKDVPAYKYKSDSLDWHPIYDDQSSHEYGSSDFTECCKIFDMIRHRILYKWADSKQ